MYEEDKEFQRKVRNEAWDNVRRSQSLHGWEMTTTNCDVCGRKLSAVTSSAAGSGSVRKVACNECAIKST